MTNREAIDILTNIKNTPRVIWTNGADTVFELAIKALEFIEENFPKTFDDYLNGEEE